MKAVKVLAVLAVTLSQVFCSFQAAQASQKLCSPVMPGNWRDSIPVPASWTMSTCKSFADAVRAPSYNLGCIFEDSFSFGAIDGGIPSPNCGWVPVPEVVGTIAVGDYPIALAWDGTFLWVANKDDDTVQKIDPQNESVVATYPVGNSWGEAEYPRALAWDGNYLWVANYYPPNSTVQKIDPATGTIAANIPVDSRPVALTWHGGFIWVTNFAAHTVQKIDPGTHQVVDTISVGLRPGDLVWKGTSSWVTSGSGHIIQEIDFQTHTIEREIPVGPGPDQLAWDGTHLWVSSPGYNTVQKVDLQTEEVVTTVPVDDPIDIIWDEMFLWATNFEGDTVQGIFGDSLEVTLRVAQGPRAFAWDGTHLWVACARDNHVVKIDPRATP